MNVRLSIRILTGSQSTTEVSVPEIAIASALNGDAFMREFLVSKSLDALRLASWILGDEQSAEDAVQEAVLVAWERRRSLRDGKAVDAWFNSILTNVCRQELRRRRRRTLPWLEPDQSVDPFARPGPDDELVRAIARLTPDEQILLASRFSRDLTVAQIAGELGLAEGTVKSRLHFALSHLRAAVDADRRREEIR